MDFGSDNTGGFSPENAAEIHKRKGFGSGFLKQERAVNEDEFRDFKLSKISPFTENTLKIPYSQMLSFSSSNSSLPCYQHTSAPVLSRNTGMSGASMHGMLSGIKGPFTPSQWIELEHQALIYKYIMANVPIPSHLLNPIRKAMESAGFPIFSNLRSNTLGWGGFHLGFPNSDPEPGRCRRTDGKKWRCSRDAVADQKYCERHMNRGRHRSRKPVEGQSATGNTTTAGKLTTPPASSMSVSSVVATGGGACNSLALSHHNQLNNLHSASDANAFSGIPFVNRSYLQKDNADGCQHTAVLSMEPPKISFEDNSQYSIPKPQNAYQESASQTEFGLVYSDSLLNPLNKSSLLMSCRNYGTSGDLNDHETKSQLGLRQFMDDWPKSQSEGMAISWASVDLQPDRSTQLSISIPITTSDYMSSTSSPTNEELEATQMGLGVGTTTGEQSQRQTMSWVPVSWETSMGGPLGEVLHTTNSECKNGGTKALNFIESWDNSSRITSSPTGVLQRGSLGSLSNSSAGSSPRAESSKTLDGIGLIAPGPMHQL